MAGRYAARLGELIGGTMDIAATLLAVGLVGLAAFLLAGPWPPRHRAGDPDLKAGGTFLDPRYIFGVAAAFVLVIALQARLVEPWPVRVLVVAIVPAVVGVLWRRASDRRRAVPENAAV